MDREISYFPVQPTTCRIGNLTRLIHTLAMCVTIHTYRSDASTYMSDAFTCMSDAPTYMRDAPTYTSDDRTYMKDAPTSMRDAPAYMSYDRTYTMGCFEVHGSNLDEEGGGGRNVLHGTK